MLLAIPIRLTINYLHYWILLSAMPIKMHLILQMTKYFFRMKCIYYVHVHVRREDENKLKTVNQFCDLKY